MAQEPQVNPNALGAPASGFGQTVSFAFDPRGEVPQLNPVNSTGPRGQVQGGQRAQLSDPGEVKRQQVAPDRTMEILGKVADGFINTKIDEARTEQYLSGMQRAMAGEAVAEVRETVPWYARIFGDTPVIEGAKAYTAQSVVNKTLAEQSAAMPELQKLSGPEAAKHFNQVVKSAMTGDANVDMVIMKAMSDNLPSLMKAQAKANYGYNQKQAAQAMSTSIATGAEALQAVGESYANDTMDQKAYDARSAQFVASVVPPAGIDEEHYIKSLSSNLKGMAAKGQFHAIEALRKSGLFSVLPPDQATAIEGAIESSANKARNNYAFKFAKDMAELKSDAAHPAEGQTPNDIAERIDRMNAAFQKLTGAPKGLYSSDEKADMLTGTLNAFKAEDAKLKAANLVLTNKQATADAKAAAAAAIDAVVDKAVSDGEIAWLKTQPGVTQDAIDRKVLEKTMRDPIAGSNLLANAFVKSNYVNEVMAQDLQAKVRNSYGRESPTADWFASVDQYRHMAAQKGGWALANAYFGPEAHKIARAVSMLGGKGNDNPDASAIYQNSMDESKQAKPSPLNKEEKAGLVSAVEKQSPGWFSKTFGGAVKLRPDTMAIIYDNAEEYTEKWRTVPGMTNEDATARGVAQAVSDGKLELVGGYAVVNPAWQKGKKPPSLREIAENGDGQFFLSIPAGKTDAYFAGFLKDRIKVSDTTSTSIRRMGEAGGMQNYAIVGTGDDGLPKVFNFNSLQWRQYASERTATDTTPAPPDKAWYRAGPKLVEFDTVNPYSSQAERAAQAAKNASNKMLRESKKPGMDVN